MARRQLMVAMWLALVAAVLAVVVVVRDRQDAFGRASGQELTWDVWRRDVVAVEGRGDGIQLAITRSDGGAWEGGAADDVASLLDALEEARRGRRVDGAEEEATGLASPVRLTVRQVDGTVAELEVGGAAPVGGRTYVRRPDGVVLGVHGDLRDALMPWSTSP